MLSKLSEKLEEQFPEEIRTFRELYFKFLIWKENKKLEKYDKSY